MVKVKGGFDKFFLELDLTWRYTFDLSNVLDALIDIHVDPYWIKLWAHTKLVTVILNTELIKVLAKNLYLATSSFEVHCHDIEHRTLTSSIRS